MLVMGNGRGSIAPLGGGAPGGGEVQPGRRINNGAPVLRDGCGY